MERPERKEGETGSGKKKKRKRESLRQVHMTGLSGSEVIIWIFLTISKKGSFSAD